jgi:hypothetical protein
MGMFDTIQCEVDLPDDCTVLDRSFQTKSLCCIGDNFTITRQGRLILHRTRYECSSAKKQRGMLIPVPVADVDTEYHGDIEMYGSAVDNKLARYAVRFTHGALEWIRPLDELEEIHRILLTNRP